MSASHAIAIGRDGTPHIDQKIKIKNGGKWITSTVPSSEPTSADRAQRAVRTTFLNCTTSLLPYSNCCHVSIIGLVWPKLEAEVYPNGETVTFKPIPKVMQNVDSFGSGHKRVFRFRKIEKPEEATAVSAKLNSEVPSADKVQKYVDEAIFLYQLDVDRKKYDLSTNPAPKGSVGLIYFYWLNNIGQRLQYTSQSDTSHYLAPSDPGKDLLITFPIHPDADVEKVEATAALLRKRFEETLGREFEAEHIPSIPLSMTEPDTIQSNYPTREEMGD